MTKTFETDLILTKNTIFDEDIIVKGNISGKDGWRYNLIVKGNLNCWNLNCWDLNCKDLNCKDLNCKDLNCWDLNCKDLNCRNLNCWNLNCLDLNCLDLNCRDLNCLDLSFYAVCSAYNNIKCKSIKGLRKNSKYFVLDGKIIINGEEEKK